MVAQDRAKVLASRLLTKPGIQPYMEMRALHGDLVARVVGGVLAKMAIDGAPPDKIKSWRYFQGPLKDAQRADCMASNGIRPGDAFGAWRDQPYEEPPF